MAATDVTAGMGLGTGGGANSTPGILGGLYDLIMGLEGKGNQQGQAAASIADPLSALNSTTLPMLEKLLTDPSSIKGTPGYQFAVQQGQDAISRAANAQTGSADPTRVGSLGPALAKYTEGYALQDYNQQIQNLLATLPSNPTAAATSLLAGNTRNDQNIAGGLTAVGSILQSLGIPQAMWKYFTGGQGGALTDPTAGLGGGGETGGIPTMMPGDSTSFNPDDWSGWMSGAGGNTDLGGMFGGDWTSGFDLGLG